MATGGGGGGGGEGGGGTSVSGSLFTSAALSGAATTPATPGRHPPADDAGGGGREIIGAAAARLAASSPSARFLASAWRSLHVNLPLEPPAGRGVEDWAAKAACARASNGLLSLLGGGSETGVYAVPCQGRGISYCIYGG